MCEHSHSTVWGAGDFDASHSRVNDMTEQVIVGEAMRKHPIEGITVRQSILALASTG
jgi:hypothetical protein